MSNNQYKKNYYLIKILIQFFLILKTEPNKIIRIGTNQYYTSQRHGSIYGGSILYITAEKIDNLNFQNQVLVGTIDCKILNHYTTPTSLACQIPKGYYLSEIVPIRVIVNNTDLLCNICDFNFRKDISPYITSIIPNAVVFGERIQINGFLALEIFEEINEVLVGGHNCDFSGYEGERGKMSRWSRYEYLRCNMGEEIEPGYHQLRFRSVDFTGFAAVLKKASSFVYGPGNKRFHVKVHPKIEELSSGKGFGTGQIIDVKGIGFGNDVSKVSVSLEGYAVDILSVDNTNVKVKIRENSSLNPRVVFEGGAGVKMIYSQTNYHFSTYMAADTYPLLDNSIISIKLTIESIEFKNSYLERYSGMFKAPVTGNYKFKISSDDEGILKISKDPVDFNVAFDEDTMMETLCESLNNIYRNFYSTEDDSQIYNKEMISGKHYYIIVMHRQAGGSSSLALSLQIPNIDEKKVNKSPKVSKIFLSNTQINEKVSIKIWNASGGTFKLTYLDLDENDQIIYNQSVNDIPFDVDSSTMYSIFRSQIGLKTALIVRYSLDNLGNRDPAYVNADGGFEWVFDYTVPRNHQVLPSLNSSDLLGNSKTKVERIVNPSPIISGSFKIKIQKTADGVISEETTDEILFSAVEETIIETLMKLDMIDDGINLEKKGSDALGYTWHIIWDSLITNETTSYTISIVESTITGGDPNFPASITISDVETASNNLFYYQIPSDFLSTFHDKPQIVIDVNGIKAACSIFNCGYSLYPDTNIPTVDTWSVTNENISLNLLAGYDTLPDAALLTMDNLSVIFGESDCQINSVSLPNFTCSLPTNSNGTPIIVAGDYKPIVHLKNRGYLNISLNADSYPLTVSSVIPASGTVTGGTWITLAGTGYSSNTIVTVGGNDCVVKNSTNIEIVCVTPVGTVGSSFIIVTQGSLTANSNHFSYSLSSTPTISNLSITSASPVLKNDLTITGTNFGTDKNDLTVKLLSLSNDLKIKRDYLCNIISLTGNEILCILEGGFSSDYKIIVARDGYGYSKPSVADGDKFTYGIYIDSISPINGSKEGGTILTITGENFSTKKNGNQVLIGENQDYCVVQTATATELTCKTNKPKVELTGVQTVSILGRIIEKANCRGNCNFEFKSSETIVSSIFPLTGINNEEIKITGSNFNPNDIVITLTKDGFSQDFTNTNGITSITNTQIIFNFPMLESGDYMINVSVIGNGLAEMPINKTFINIFKLDSNTPTTGFYGGNNLEINGNGFIETDEVFIEDIICINKEFINNTLIKCRMKQRNLFAASLSVIVRRDITDITCNECKYLTFPENSNTRIPETTPSSFTIGTNIIIIRISVSPQGILDMGLVTVSLISNIDENLKFDATSVSLNVDNIVEAVFNIDIPGGDYTIDYFVSGKGYARHNNGVGNFRINLADVSSFTLNAIQSSFAGGKIGVITGSGFKIGNSKAQNVKVCGLPAKILTSAYNQLTFETPIMLSQISNSEFNMVKASRLTPVAITDYLGSNEDKLNDGDFSTYFNSGSDSCWFQYDFGFEHKALIEYIAFFPRLGSNHDYLEGAVIKGSNDGSIFTNLFNIKDNVIENWNEIKPNKEGDWNYRYIRFEGRKCSISEFKVFGFNYSNLFTNTTSHQCDVIYESEGTNLIFTSKVEYRKDKTPVITSLNPKMGTTTGGTSVTFIGENLSNTFQIIIDEIICTLRTSTASTTACTTVARPLFTETSLKIKTSDGFAVI